MGWTYGPEAQAYPDALTGSEEEPEPQASLTTTKLLYNSAKSSYWVMDSGI